MKDFYKDYPGRVISTTIDKYVYAVINQSPFLRNNIIRYSQTESVKDSRDIKHPLFREALIKFGIHKGLEVSSFADIEARTGLGSSSSFSVALVKALHAQKGNSISKEQAAREACELEIDIIKDPIGKQDQYAAAFGGFNIFQFNADETVNIEAVSLDLEVRQKLEDHLLLFYTGITRSAGSVLGEQKQKIADNFETYKRMSDSVLEFRDKLVGGDIRGIADMLSEGWKRKKSLASGISNSTIDVLYEAGMQAGAWGGKILGAGGGGCLLFVVPQSDRSNVLEQLEHVSHKSGLEGFLEIPFACTDTGADMLFSSLPRS